MFDTDGKSEQRIDSNSNPPGAPGPGILGSMPTSFPLHILGSSTFSVVLAQYPLLRRRNLSTYFERYYRNV